jgi:1-phosphatidylinositol-3-phosphate 5-kinase
MFKQKGQVRVCNFCYAEQLRQYHLIKDTLSNTHTTINAGSASINDSSKPDYISSMATSNTTKTKTDLLQLQPVDQNENTYSSPIIPSQKAPLAAPQMQIPTTALKQARSTYGNDDTTTFALEIPIRSSDSFMKAGSPQLPAFIERPHSFNAYHDNDTNLDSPGNVIPAITTTGASHSDLTATGGLKRLFDAGTSLLKSSASSRPRSNTSSSAPLEDTRYAQSHHQSPFSPYALDRGGGTVLAESELSPYPGTNPTSIDLFQDQLHDHHHPSYLNNNNNNNNNDRYQQHQNSSCTVPTATTSSPPIIFSTIQTPPSKGSHLFHPPHQSYSHRPELILPSSSHILPNTMIGSDNESYDHRLRLKRTEELRGQNLPCSASASGHPSFSSPRRLSLTGSSSSGGGGNLLKTPNGTASKKSSRSSKIRINTIGLPKSTNHYDFNENLSPNPLVSPFLMEDMNKPIDSLTLSRLRLPPRTRRQSSSTAGLPQTVELSLSARTHARKMLKQLMEDITIANHSKEEWEEVIMQLLLKVTNHVQPDIRAGDVMDVRHYVKVKKIPGGLPSDSFYVKGIVCTKNVAHKRMVRNISHPRILILMFSLDYSRVEMENQLLSIAPVISQEREHIRKLVGRIVALKPSLLLVKSTVSRLALEFLLEANIPVVHNVKHSVIEAVARCTQASIVTSVDKLQHGLSFGRCGSFEIRTILHEWIPNRRKTFLVFDDCAPELGGTIVLRGEKLETLRVIKRLIDFMVFVVNNLKLETSLLLDSFAKSRGSTELDSDTFERNRSPLIQTTTATATSINNKSNKHCSESMISTTTSQHEYNDDDAQTVNSHYINDLLSLYQNTILSVSQFVVFSPPYLLLVLKETEDKLALIHQQKRRKSVSGSSIMTNTTSINFKEANTIPNSVSPTRSTFEKQSIIDQHYHMPCEEDGAILDAEYDLIAKSRQVSRAWETYTGENPGSISPFYHQNIVVLYSSVCTVTTVPCQGPEIRMFGFYRLPSDITLGQYVMDFCNDARQPCSSFMCDHPMMQHYRSYAHGNARINVMIEPFPCPLSGMSYKLLMWSYCKLCDKPTPVLPMSENTWNYSFGKFLETFLYQRGVHCRADICPHDMARNHVRYFGYKDMTVRFQYDPIELLEVATPPMKLFIQSQVQMDLKEEELKSLRSKINKFYQSIIERNKAFPFDLVDPHKLEACKAELQDMSLEAQGEKKDALQLVQNVYATSDPLDTLTIQVVRRNLFQVLAHWGAVYADFVQYYLQPERELKKITTNQLRKMFPADMSDTSLFNHMDNERTKRATEVTDLPLLGIGLDDEDDDALIGHIMKRKTAATKSNEIKAKAANNQMLMPFLSTTPSANLPALWNPAESNHTMDSFKFDLVPQQQVDSDHKNSFLRPERRRRLSLDLLHKLDEKFKATEENQRNVIGGLISLNRMTSNKFLRAKSPGALSATFTPSRIPILRQHQQRHSSPTLYEPFQHHQRNSISAYVDSTSTPTHLDPRYLDYHRNSHNNHKKGKHIERRGSIINTQGNDSSSNGSDKQLIRTTFENSHSKHKRRNRHHSISHNQHVQPNRFEVNDDDNDAEDENSTGHSAFLKRSAASRGDRRLRSRLPRKKTYIQVYTHANELVTEDIDDEFAEGNVHMHLAREDAMRLHLSASKKRKYHSGDSNYYSGGRRRDTYAPKPLLSRFYQDNGIDADNDDNDLSGDSSDGSDKNSNRNSNLDYFSSFAPYAHQVMEQGKLPEGITAKREQRRKSLLPSNAVSKTRSANSTSQQYPIARSYFPFSDGQMDMSSGLSGDDENERDLPLASDLLKIQQSSASIEDNTNLDHLPNIVPDIIVDGVEDLTTSNALTAESSDDIRHSAEKISFMKTLTNFLTDSGVGNLLPLESPL